MSMTEENMNYFQETARNWDTTRAGYFGDNVRQVAIAKAYLRPEMAVADIGSGTGFVAAALAPLVRRVYVVDGSLEMLDVARKNLGAFTNVEYHQADGLDLPFPEESLDAVFANMYLHHCPDPLAALREMARILRPGGRLVITDIDEHSHTWMKKEMADLWLGFNRSQLRNWMREAGLVNVIMDCSGESCSAESNSITSGVAGKDQAKISIFVAIGTRRIPIRDAVRDAYGSLAQSGGSCCGSSSTLCCGNDRDCSCAPGTVAILPDYLGEDLSAAPQEAASFSLGCGNPLAMAELQSGEVVLDIGSGGGLDCFLAAARVGAEGRVIGVDMTSPMLERARAAAQRSGINTIEFREGLAENLPVEDNSVNVVMSNCVINLAEDKGLVFNEAFRVIQPGGRLEVSDIVTSSSMPAEVIENGQAWADCISGALPEQEYLDLVAQAGFEQITLRRKTSAGTYAGVTIYSVAVSARKPAAPKTCCG
jgi:ubiquinone/menaquinone biosynthesis C-methylase UbiE